MLTVTGVAAHRAAQNVSLALRRSIRSASSATSNTPAGRRIFNTDLLEFLVCPLSKGELRYNVDKQELISDEIGVAYPIVAGIPRLIPSAGCLIDATNANSGSQA